MSSTHIPAGLRRLVRERAKERCEYCLFPEAFSFFSFEIDHIISEKHGGTTVANNLALSCMFCNQHKGTDIASIELETSQIVPLFHPRHDVWREHFVHHDGNFAALTLIGKVTAKLLQFNDPQRVAERKNLVKSSNYDCQLTKQQNPF